MSIQSRLLEPDEVLYLLEKMTVHGLPLLYKRTTLRPDYLNKYVPGQVTIVTGTDSRLYLYDTIADAINVTSAADTLPWRTEGMRIFEVVPLSQIYQKSKHQFATKILVVRAVRDLHGQDITDQCRTLSAMTNDGRLALHLTFRGETIATFHNGNFVPYSKEYAIFTREDGIRVYKRTCADEIVGVCA